MTEKEFYLKVLESAIFIRHKCKAIHRETVFVCETALDNKTVWAGTVEVFDLAWHDTARACYSWFQTSQSEPPRIFAILANGVIDSPERAVQAAIFAEEQPLTPPDSISSRLGERGIVAQEPVPSAPSALEVSAAA